MGHMTWYMSYLLDHCIPCLMYLVFYECVVFLNYVVFYGMVRVNAFFKNEVGVSSTKPIYWLLVAKGLPCMHGFLQVLNQLRIYI